MLGKLFKVAGAARGKAGAAGGGPLGAAGGSEQGVIARARGIAPSRPATPKPGGFRAMRSRMSSRKMSGGGGRY